MAAAAGDGARLDALVARRLTGEPLEWITGRTEFCGLSLRVEPGVYVPRWHSEVLVRRAAERLPDGGVAVDVCTGCGALARVLLQQGGRVVATDLDERAVACARANGVEAYQGDLLAPVPRELEGRVDVVAGVVPFVPTEELGLLQRDTFAFETPLAYDGGADGTDLLRRVVADAPRLLRAGGALVLGLGGDQAAALDWSAYEDVAVLRDDDGDVRGVEATRRRA